MVLAWVSAARPVIAQEPNAKVGEQRNSTASQSAIDRWITELGSDSYPIRQSAAEQLLAAGMSARNALIQLTDGADPETRAAARRLVSLIDRTEFRRSLDAFAADTDGQRGLTLPGWEAFQKLVGSDPACRTLFVDMQRQEGSLLATAFGISKKPPDELWEDRLQRVAQWQTSASERGAAPPLGSCAAMLFLGCSHDMNVSDSAATIVDILIQRSPVREALLSESGNEAIRKLVAAWILNCPNNNEVAIRSRLNLTATFSLAGGLPLALAIISGEPAYARVQPSLKAHAAMIVGQLGDRSHVEKLEPLLNDSTVCLSMQLQGPGLPPNVVQVRDVALVMLLTLTEQSPADYGYLVARAHPGRRFDIQSLFRENDQHRAESIAKWRAWRANHQDGNAKESAPSPPKASEE